MAAEEKKPGEEKIPVIRTLKSDAAEYVAEGKTSFLSMAAQKLKRRREFEPPSEKNRRKIYFLIAGAAVFALVLAGGAWFYLLKPAEEEPAVLAPPEPLVFPDEKVTIELESSAREDLILKIREALYKNLEAGAFRTLNFFLEPQEFLNLAEVKPPPRLRDQITALTMGALNKEGVIHPFLIFKIVSFPEAFQGALLWERTVPDELRALFKNLPLLDAPPAFRDLVVKNQDSRTLSAEGGVVLTYAFFNRQLLIFTDSEKALAEIITRYAVFPPR